MGTTTKGRCHIAVIGAGLAGLACALRLGEQGHAVTVLERQPRIGGRARTLRDPLSPGLWADAGPSRFPAGSVRVRTQAARLGLRLVPFYPDRGRFVAHLQGRRIEGYRPRPGDFWGYSSSRPPTGSFPRRLRGAFARGARRALGRPARHTVAVHQGAERLAEALAEATKATGVEIRLNARVEALVQGERSVAVGWTDGAGSDRESVFRYVVCATPLSTLGEVRFDPPLQGDKAELPWTVPFSSAVRIALEMRRPFWRNQGLNGFAITDTVGEVWAPAHAGPDPPAAPDSPAARDFPAAPDFPAVLVCYAKGSLADALCALTEEDRVAHAVTELERVLPGAAPSFRRGTSVCWNRQRWIPGGWPLVRDGFAERVETFRSPAGRIFFAGDYATRPEWLNTAEGALESGDHAARSLHATALGSPAPA